MTVDHINLLVELYIEERAFDKAQTTIAWLEKRQAQRALEAGQGMVRGGEKRAGAGGLLGRKQWQAQRGLEAGQGMVREWGGRGAEAGQSIEARGSSSCSGCLRQGKGERRQRKG